MGSRSDRIKHLIVDFDLLGNVPNRNNTKQSETPYQNTFRYALIQPSTQRHRVVCAINLIRNTIMSIQLSKASTDAIRVWTNKSIEAEGKQTTMVDALVADGVVAEMLLSKDNQFDSDLTDSVKSAIVLGFSKSAQSLLAFTTAEAKKLPDAKKADRRYWHQQVGSKLKDLRNALNRRKERGASSTATALQLLERDLASVVKRATGLDPAKDSIPDCFPLTEIVAEAKKLKAKFDQSIKQ